MDYRLIAETLKWHAVYSDLNGAELRTLVYLATSAHYKTSRVSASYNELADALGLSKASVSKAIASLVQKKALAVDVAPSGRLQATYRVRTADDLNGYFVRDVNNTEADVWMERESALFGTVIDRALDIGAGCADCEALDDAGSEEKCPMHAAQLRAVHDSEAWREYQMWLADNPRPPAKIKQIHGKTVLAD